MLIFRQNMTYNTIGSDCMKAKCSCRSYRLWIEAMVSSSCLVLSVVVQWRRPWMSFASYCTTGHPDGRNASPKLGLSMALAMIGVWDFRPWNNHDTMTTQVHGQICRSHTWICVAYRVFPCLPQLWRKTQTRAVLVFFGFNSLQRLLDSHCILVMTLSFLYMQMFWKGTFVTGFTNCIALGFWTVLL